MKREQDFGYIDDWGEIISREGWGGLTIRDIVRS